MNALRSALAAVDAETIDWRYEGSLLMRGWVSGEPLCYILPTASLKWRHYHDEPPVSSASFDTPDEAKADAERWYRERLDKLAGGERDGGGG